MFRLCLFRLKDTFSQWPSEDEWWTKTFLLNLEQFWLIHERFVYMCFCLCFSHWFEVGVARLNYWKYYVICQYVLALIKGFVTFNWTDCYLVCHEDLISSRKTYDLKQEDVSADCPLIFIVFQGNMYNDAW